MWIGLLANEFHLNALQVIGIDKVTGVHYEFLMELAELVSSPAIQLPSLSVGYELFSLIASIFDCYSSWCLNLCSILLLWSDLSCVSHCTGNPVSVGLQWVVSAPGSFLQNCAVCLPSSFSLSPQIPFVLAADSHISIDTQVLVLHKSIPEVWKVV